MSEYVVFSKHGARHIKGHWLMPHRSPFVKVIKHPDLSHVEGAPSYFWKLDKGRIVEMLPSEKQVRLQILNSPLTKYKTTMQTLYPLWMKVVWIFMIGSGIYFHKYLWSLIK